MILATDITSHQNVTKHYDDSNAINTVTNLIKIFLKRGGTIVVGGSIAMNSNIIKNRFTLSRDVATKNC